MPLIKLKGIDIGKITSKNRRSNKNIKRVNKLNFKLVIIIKLN